jgi:hypothetical protein
LSPFEYESNLKDLFDLKDMMSDIRDDISGTVSVKFRAKCIEICINMHYFINVTFVT